MLLRLNRGIAQLVAYLVWDQRVASSNLATPTNKSLSAECGGLYFFHCDDSLLSEAKEKNKDRSERSE